MKVVTISSWLNFGHPAPRLGVCGWAKVLGSAYYSQRAVFTSLQALFSFVLCYSSNSVEQIYTTTIQFLLNRLVSAFNVRLHKFQKSLKRNQEPFFQWCMYLNIRSKCFTDNTRRLCQLRRWILFMCCIPACVTTVLSSHHCIPCRVLHHQCWGSGRLRWWTCYKKYSALQ